MRRLVSAVGWMLLGALAVPSWTSAHEERLVIGRVEVVDLAKKVLVVRDPERDRTVRLTVDPETEVRRCRHGTSLAAVPTGARVRVKYLDKPGGAFEALSILILPGPK